MNNRHEVARTGVRTVALRGFLAARRLALASTVSVLALGAGMASAQEAAEAGADNAGWSAHGTLTARAGTERHIGELDLFVPLWQSESSMLYGDLRGQTDDAGNMEGNAGLGFRNMGESWILGGYGFFDYRKSDETGNSFMQGTLGVEALTDSLDLRANIYLPEGGEQTAASATTLEVVGGSLQMRAGLERALPGLDGEVGYRLWGSQDGDSEVRAFAGGYYFDAADYDTVAGGRGRVEARLFDLGFLGEGSRFTLGAEVTQDNVRDTQGFATARLTIPFGGGRRSGRGGLDRRMTDYVVRDVDIITASAATGTAEATSLVEFGTNVTVLTAADDIVAATADGNVDDLFIVDGSAGTFNTTTTIALQNGQTLLGGRDFEVVGVDSGTRMTYAGTRPTINGDVGGGAVVALANNSTMADIDIENISTLDSSSGIDGTAVTGAFVSNNSIMTAGRGGYGMYLDGGSANTLGGNSITTVGAAGMGLYLTGSTGNIVDGNNIATSGLSASGVYAVNGNSDNTFSNNVVVVGASLGKGMNLVGGTNNKFIGNSITTLGSMGTGVYLVNATGSIVDGNDIATSGAYGYGVAVTNDGNIISNNSIKTGSFNAHGILVHSASSNKIDNNVIATGKADTSGIFLTDPNAVGVDWNTGVGNSYSGSGNACTVDPSVTGLNNSIDLCP